VYICEKASGVSSVAAYDLIFPGVYTVSSGSTTNKKRLIGWRKPSFIVLRLLTERLAASLVAPRGC
jgi:hypothetical protein